MKIKTISIDSLIVLKIFENSEIMQGLLLGVEEDSILTITNAFKTGSSAEFNEKMLEHLEKINYERNVVGRFSNLSDVYGQVQELFEFQKDNKDGIYFYCEQSPPRLTALRLSDKFMATNLKNITGKVVKDLGLNSKEIFETIPIVIKNSFILEALNIQIMSGLVDADPSPIQKSIESQLEELIEAVEDQGQEYWRWQAWHRSYQKELKASKTSGEPGNALNAPEEASIPLTKTPALNKILATEPGRLETLLLAYEIDKHSEELLQLAA